MSATGDDRTSRRTITIVLTLGWALLGIWWISDGEVAVGIAFLVLAALSGLALVWPRADAVLNAPLFRRR